MEKKELAKIFFDKESNYKDMVASILILPRLEIAYGNGFLAFLNEAEKKKYLQLCKLAEYWHDKYVQIENEIQKLRNSKSENTIHKIA